MLTDKAQTVRVLPRREVNEDNGQIGNGKTPEGFMNIAQYLLITSVSVKIQKDE